MKREYTTVNISPKALEVIKKYGSIHHWSPFQFFEVLSQTLLAGLDGLEEWSVEDLRKVYKFSDLILAQDVRVVFGAPKVAEIMKNEK